MWGVTLPSAQGPRRALLPRLPRRVRGPGVAPRPEPPGGVGGGAVPPGLPVPPALQPHGGGVWVQRFATFVLALLREGPLGGRAESRRGSGH